MPREVCRRLWSPRRMGATHKCGHRLRDCRIVRRASAHDRPTYHCEEAALIKTITPKHACPCNNVLNIEPFVRRAIRAALQVSTDQEAAWQYAAAEAAIGLLGRSEKP